MDFPVSYEAGTPGPELETVKGRAIAEYEADLMLRSAVERQFGIVGEALSQLAKAAPDLAARIPELRNAVSFRNVLIHGYDRIEDRLCGGQL